LLLRGVKSRRRAKRRHTPRTGPSRRARRRGRVHSATGPTIPKWSLRFGPGRNYFWELSLILFSFNKFYFY
jgi:hypothetical protein